MKSKLNLEMGARNNAKTEREKNDFYATDPKTIFDFLVSFVADDNVLSQNIWECACGQGHISNVLKEAGYNVKSTDLIDRGYGIGGVDFLKEVEKFDGDIITNPPYKLACQFALHGLSLVKKDNFVILYVKDRFLESERRFKDLFSIYPPKFVYAHVSRQKCAMNGDFNEYCKSAGSQFYMWVIFQKEFSGNTVLRWI